MKKRVFSSISLFLIGAMALNACSDPEVKKRNDFDACVLNWLKDNGYDFVGYNGGADTKAKTACAYLLD